MTMPAARRWTGVLILGLSASLAYGQTVIKPPKNNFTPQQDVEIGKKAADEIRAQYPIIKDEQIQRYLTKLGDRLVAVAPPELNQSVYQYSFTPVNLKEINAFALPGGPMFVQRGMFDAAASEAEVVGVMAHELSHVLLRHGTANATKAQNPWLQIGQIAGVLGGAVVGGAAGSAIAQGSQFGLGTLMMRYSRDFEKQADLMGSQLMARAGYDPRALAHMFETINAESAGQRDPEWLSSHPDPGNRTEYITAEATKLRLGPAPDSRDFPVVKTRFASLPKAMTTAELAKRTDPNANNNSGGGNNAAGGSTGTPGRPVPEPSMQLRTLNASVFQANVPGNWTTMSSSRSIRVVPENGYGDMNGQTVFTHGVEFGLAKPGSRDLVQATDMWLNAIAQDNPQLRSMGNSQVTRMSQRSTIVTNLTNESPLGGVERVTAYTTFLSDGTLFYYLTVCPERDLNRFNAAFGQIAASVRFTDAR